MRGKLDIKDFISVHGNGKYLALMWHPCGVHLELNILLLIRRLTMTNTLMGRVILIHNIVEEKI